MRSISLRCAVMIVVLFLLASCGGGGSDTPVCTQTGNMSLYTSSTGSTLLSSITATTPQSIPVPSVPVFVGYKNPPVAAVVAGYPTGAVNPSTYGIDLHQIGTNAENPLEFSITFDSNHAPGIYKATWRFVVVDAGVNVVGCQDLPVTYTIN